MNALIRLAEAWWPLYAVHIVEVSLFILLVWAVDRWMTLDTRLRYVLYLLALVKAFVPPFYAIPLPGFLTSSPDVMLSEPVYSDVVSEAGAVAPVQVATLPLAFYLFCLWVASALVWTGVTLWKNAAFHRALNMATPVDLTRKLESLNEARDLKVYAKAGLRSPLLVGLVKPRLYLPTQWSSWSPEQLRGVVAHELAHRDNRDMYALILQTIAMALFGLNPLIWLVNRKLIYLRELRCDEAVLRETNLTPAEYGHLLLGFVDRRPALSALTLYFNERGTALKERLKHILNFKEGNVKWSKQQLAIPILIGLAIVPFSIREAYTQPPQIAPKREPMPASGDADSSEALVLELFARENLEGKVFLKLKANADSSEALVLELILDGWVSDVDENVLKERVAIFKEAAIEAISQLRFKPAEHNVKVGPVQMTQVIRFPLSKQQAAPSDSGDAGGGKVFEVFKVETKPKRLNSVKPVYPDSARTAGLTGKVFLRCKVNVDGSVSDVKVLGTIGSKVFQKAAIETISQYRFKPAEHKGKVVPVRMVQVIRFELPKQQTLPPPDESVIYGYHEVETKPVVTHKVQPVYPDSARTAGLTGKVFLRFKVNVDGSVSDVSVLEGEGPAIFQKAAIEAVSQWRFKPAQHKGKIVPVWMTLPIYFRLPRE